MTTGSPVRAAQGRIPLITTLLVLAVLSAQLVVGVIVSLPPYLIQADPQQQPIQQLLPLTLLPLVRIITTYLPFAVGVFLALRFVAPVAAGDAWRRVIRAGIIAAALGAAVFFVVGYVEQLSPHLVAPPGGFFGYGGPLGLATSGYSPVAILVQVLAAAITSLVSWLPLVVLAVVAQKLWLAAHSSATVTDRVSPSGKP